VIRIQRASGRVEAPWKNGGGVTREVAAYPPGTGSGDFDWRISIASVSRGGPFSVFPGVDRELAVLEGTLRLSIAGRPEISVRPGSPPARFAGDVPCEGAPGDTPVTDLNVMTRRGKHSSQLTWLSIERQHMVHARSARTFILAVDALTLVSRGLAYQLHAQDLAELQPEDGDVTLLAHTARCILIELTRA
jgi:environmental stress-induced protein Ves